MWTFDFLFLGLKKHLTAILAGLLEVNPQKMWTFEKFFAEVTKAGAAVALSDFPGSPDINLNMFREKVNNIPSRILGSVLRRKKIK